MEWIENVYPSRFLRDLKILAITLPPVFSLISWVVISFLASRSPDSFLSQNPILILILSLLPLGSWGAFWRVHRLRVRRWPSRVGVGTDGIVAEYESSEHLSRRFSWEEIEGIRIFSQPLGWPPVALLVRRGGDPYMDMEVHGKAAYRLKRLVGDLKPTSSVSEQDT